MKQCENASILPGFTNSEYPVIVKKQQKYNINRWAVTGRSDQKLNTFCHRAAKQITHNKSLDVIPNWQKVLQLAASDLRTHIEIGRWSDALALLDKVRSKLPTNKKEKKDRSF